MESPLGRQALAPLTAEDAGISFGGPLTRGEYQQLADLLERHPDKKLLASQPRSSRYESIVTDLTPLGSATALRRLDLTQPPDPARRVQTGGTSRNSGSGFGRSP